jgi:hypothetical protein
LARKPEFPVVQTSDESGKELDAKHKKVDSTNLELGFAVAA